MENFKKLLFYFQLMNVNVQAYYIMIIMMAINNLSKDITIILIAHRLNTVKNCDIIFQLDKGKLKNKGTFKELINDDSQFRHNNNIN